LKKKIVLKKRSVTLPRNKKRFLSFFFLNAKDKIIFLLRTGATCFSQRGASAETGIDGISRVERNADVSLTNQWPKWRRNL